jgi:succinyl-CoA synthetase beta subunit
LKLYEFEAKKLLSQYGIAVPKGTLIPNNVPVREAIVALKTPLVVKSQVLVAARRKAGGILFTDTAEETEKTAKKLLKTQINGIPVKKVLIEEKLQTEKELYCGITIDRAEQKYVFLASMTGGTEIEETASKSPEKILKTLIDPLRGFRSFHARNVAKKLGYSGATLLALTRIFEKLYRISRNCDAELIEINPLAEMADGSFIALDARIIIDDNALFRHPEYKKKLVEEERDLSPQETEALRNELVYVKLAGNVGVIGNGAGLVMASLDMITSYSGKPANFLDVGGGAPRERIVVALDIVLSDPDVAVLFVNIIGGITLCDDVAHGIIEATKRIALVKPMVVRLVGTNEEQGKRILEKANIPVLKSLEEAASRVVEIAKRG